MASHHNPHHLHGHGHHCQNPVPTPTTITTTTTSCCSCCYNHCCTQQSHHPSASSLPPPPQLPADLLQSLASLLQQQPQQQQPNLCFPYPNKSHPHRSRHQKPRFQPQNLDFQLQDRDEQAISSLLQRINTLESSLQRLSTPPAANYGHYPSHSLRDTAARVIQTHFRVFLVRRSRTLSQLKDLAFIKSRFNSLKSSISHKTHFDFDAVSHKAMDLLLGLDSIQGRDPMIRDGKRSISRDLARFLEFIDRLAVKRHVISYKSAKNVRLFGNSNNARSLNANNGYGGLSGYQRQIMEKLRDRVENISGLSRVCENDEEDVELEGFQELIDEVDDEGNLKVCINGKHGVSKIRNGVLVKRHGGEPRAKKTVSFAENENAYRVFSDNHELVLNGDSSFADGSDSSDNQGEAMENHFSEVEERKRIPKGIKNAEEAFDNGGSAQSSKGEGIPGRNLRSVDCEVNEYCQDQDGSSVFSAPVPVKMEARADLLKRRKAMKIVT